MINIFQKIVFAACILAAPFCQAQTDEDVEKVAQIFEASLTKSNAYEWLRYLCKNIGHRLGGSPAYTAAANYTAQMLDSLGADTVWLQPVKVPYWNRGQVAKVRIVNSQTIGNQDLSCIALGFSGATSRLGLTAEVVMVKSLDELEKLGNKAKGKIIFFNRPMDASRSNTFYAYGGAVDQRSSGPRKAAELGAVACIVRSMTLKQDDIPHSGMTVFNEVKPIPALALGYQSADLLADLLVQEPNLRLNVQTDCSETKAQTAYNVIADIRGTERPNEIIVVGGHLDSWDIGEGAHDDGAGCVQAMDVLHLFKRLGIRPRHTIRCVLFANEENGMYGANYYAAYAKNNKKETHYAALESDAGGHSPRGFSMDALPDAQKTAFAKVQKWREILVPYGIYDLQTGSSAADVGKLRDLGTILFGLKPDSQRYFDYHHAQTDIFENVNKRELELGSGAMTALVYLIDKYGF